MLEKYHNLISNLKPFVVTYSAQTQFETPKEIWGIKLTKEFIIDSLDEHSSSFFDKILKLDQLSFGNQGMSMPKWVVFDCAMMPGFIVGFSISSNLLDEKDREMLGIGDNEYFPVSMYMAIPTKNSGTWFGHNLSSLNKILHYPLNGLGLLTKAYALKLFEVKSLQGATQWDSKALFIHKKFGDLKILSKKVPLHTKENTLCYECSLENLESILD